jgi:hypothetical protein
MLFLVFNSEFRNPHSPLEMPNFFMDDTNFLKCQKSNLTPETMTPPICKVLFFNDVFYVENAGLSDFLAVILEKNP